MEPILQATATLYGPTEFPILDHLVFLNHAAVAPLPTRAAEAIKTYAAEASQMGGAAWPRWAERLKKARRAGADLLGADLDEVGFIHSTTHGLLCLANSLPWRVGDNIVSAEHEFPANVHPWRNLAARGVALRAVPERPDHRFSIDDFLARIDHRTRLVSVSLVQYSTGYRMPVEQLAEVCRARDIWFCLDAIQAVGAMPTRVADLGCDFLVADGHKWILGPEGVGLIFVRQDRLGLFNDAMTGWISHERFWEYDDVRQPVVRAARRFEEGAYSIPGLMGLEQSLAVLNEVGMDEAWRRIEALTAQLTAGLARLGCRVTSPRGSGERSGIVAFDRPGLDPAACVKRLESEGIHVAARRGWIRVSPHFYNQPRQIEQFLAALERALKS